MAGQIFMTYFSLQDQNHLHEQIKKKLETKLTQQLLTYEWVRIILMTYYFSKQVNTKWGSISMCRTETHTIREHISNSTIAYLLNPQLLKHIKTQELSVAPPTKFSLLPQCLFCLSVVSHSGCTEPTTFATIMQCRQLVRSTTKTKTSGKPVGVLCVCVWTYHVFVAQFLDVLKVHGWQKCNKCSITQHGYVVMRKVLPAACCAGCNERDALHEQKG